MSTPTPATVAAVLDRAAKYLTHPDVTALPFALPSSGVALACEQLAAEVRATPPTPRFFAVYIGTTNDTNGNPRRGWYVHDLADRSAPVTWCEEGYGNFPWPAFARVLGLPSATSGDYWACRDEARPYVRETGRIDVTPGEYRSARKLPRFGGGAE